MRAYVLNRQIDDLRGTLFRQTMFAEFERSTHAAEEAGDPLTLQGFKRVYRELLSAYFGPKLCHRSRTRAGRAQDSAFL